MNRRNLFGLSAATGLFGPQVVREALNPQRAGLPIRPPNPQSWQQDALEPMVQIIDPLQAVKDLWRQNAVRERDRMMALLASMENSLNDLKSISAAYKRSRLLEIQQRRSETYSAFERAMEVVWGPQDKANIPSQAQSLR